MIEDRFTQPLKEFKGRTGRLTILTGAGISAESGIPTFRGPEGFWTIGSREYHPQELATRRAFLQQPFEVWKWYLYRMGICASAEPNPGHLAIVELERVFGDRFLLITQNVDNLHLRTGNSPDRTYQIHGNIFFTRCLEECSGEILPLPDGIGPKNRGDDLSGAEKELLACPRCGSLLRPHVLWFDETYNEGYYRFESSLAAAAQTDLLLIIGTSGATNLPNQVAWLVYENGGIIMDINIQRNPFSDLAEKSRGGAFIKGSSAAVLPALSRILGDGGSGETHQQA